MPSINVSRIKCTMRNVRRHERTCARNFTDDSYVRTRLYKRSESRDALRSFATLDGGFRERSRLVVIPNYSVSLRAEEGLGESGEDVRSRGKIWHLLPHSRALQRLNNLTRISLVIVGNGRKGFLRRKSPLSVLFSKYWSFAREPGVSRSDKTSKHPCRSLPRTTPSK